MHRNRLTRLGQLERSMAELGGLPVIPWYLTGGIPKANCIAAYRVKGAADYAGSLVNLSNPGTHDATSILVPPNWDVVTGWEMDLNCSIVTDIIPTATSSIVIQYSTTASVYGACDDGVNYFGFYQNGATIFYEKGSYVESAVIPAAGNLAIANTHGYIDGVVDKAIGVGTGIPAVAIYIRAINSNGLRVGVGHGLYVLAWAMYDIDIVSYLPVLVTAMAAL